MHELDNLETLTKVAAVVALLAAPVAFFMGEFFVVGACLAASASFAMLWVWAKVVNRIVGLLAEISSSLKMR